MDFTRSLLWLIERGMFFSNNVLLSERVTNKVWHCLVQHLHQNAIDSLVNKSIRWFDYKDNGICNSCLDGKAYSFPHKIRNTKYDHPLSLDFADFWGPTPCISSEGYKYYINFMYAKANYNWVFPLQVKSKLYRVFERFKEMTKLQCGYSIKSFQSDNGLEFKKPFSILDSYGIIHWFLFPYSHQ